MGLKLEKEGRWEGTEDLWRVTDPVPLCLIPGNTVVTRMGP